MHASDGRRTSTTKSDTPTIPYAQTHPDRLATVAILHGLEPPDPFHARVLEIGCGAGGNLIAMAAATPGHPRGRRRSRRGTDRRGPAPRSPRSGSTNVELRQADVRELTTGALGDVRLHRRPRRLRLDPAPTRATRCWRDRASHLTPDGLAYVSYNANPGGYFRRMLRDVGLWHARGDRRTRPRRPPRRRSSSSSSSDAAGDRRRHLRRAARARGADARRRRRCTGSCTTTWRALAPAVVRRVRRARGATTGSATSARPTSAACARRCCPTGVEPEVWALAGGDRIAFENYSDLLIAAPLPPERALPRRARVADPSRARARRAAALGGAPERRAARGRAARRRVRGARPRAPAGGRRSRRCARELDADPLRARRGAARRLPARAPDARTPAPLHAATRARRAPARSRRSRAGRPRTGRT